MSSAEPLETIDFASLPKHFDAVEAEKRLDALWEAQRVYHYDPSRPREETFVVDTPPPTVSGSLHVGHAFSYTHTDIIVRQRRMRGQNIFYPMGCDDNGLPTERRVQNYFNVRCDPHVAYDPDLSVEQVDPKKVKKERIPAQLVSRKNFIELCHRVTVSDEKAFTAMWRRLALSVDWRQSYATIDDHCRRLAQLSFLDLNEKGHTYSLEAPTMWDVDFQTAVAQAEVKDVPKRGAFHDIRFGVEGDLEASFIISTTRPELLPACVGVTAHPDDERYKRFFGKNAVTALFSAPVPIFPSELADPEKGTGILMVCTFGDATDVTWWREQGLELRQIIGKQGRLLPRTFGEENFVSLDPETANTHYAELTGQTVARARRRVVELLREGDNPALVGEPRPTEQAVKHYENGDRPLEYITTRQWFVRLMDQKDAMVDRGESISWHPDFMRTRYRNWTEGLGLDWCISRQRYFGVSFPVWYPLDADGNPDYENALIAKAERLPVDPMSDAPSGYEESQRDQPNGFTGEPDVFDTWFTSSLTPQIGSHWKLDEERHKNLFPADMRPQSHEIIRTWAFYTIAKAHLHEDTVPWQNVVISGWILDPDRKKMSKSKGNVVTPSHLFDEYSADGVRYWAGGARLGTDTTFDVKVLKVGKRLVTKLYNAGKFVLSQEAERHPISNELDRAFLRKLGALVTEATAAFDEFEFAKSLMATEQFFWGSFTDTYLELSKARARGDIGEAADRGSAVATLRYALGVLLRLFAPILPYITDEVWGWVFADETGQPTIHAASWPTVAEVEAMASAPDDEGSFDLAVAALQTINKRKSDDGVSVGRVTEHMVFAANETNRARLAPVWADVAGAARCVEGEHRLEAKEGLEDGVFEIVEARFAEKKPKVKQ